MSKVTSAALGISATVGLIFVIAAAAVVPLPGQSTQVKDCAKLAGGIMFCENWLFDTCTDDLSCYMIED